MGLSITLDLRHLIEALPFLPGLGIFCIQRLAAIEVIGLGEHHAVREIAVVRNGEDLPAGLVFIHLQPRPQRAGVGAALWCCRGVGHDLRDLLRAIAEDHVTVQVVALDERRPLEGEEGREPARFIEFVCLTRRPVFETTSSPRAKR